MAWSAFLSSPFLGIWFHTQVPIYLFVYYKDLFIIFVFSLPFAGWISNNIFDVSTISSLQYKPLAFTNSYVNSINPSIPYHILSPPNSTNFNCTSLRGQISRCLKRHSQLPILSLNKLKHYTGSSKKVYMILKLIK